MRRFYISRWKYFAGYALVAILVVASIWAYDKAMDALGMIAAVIAVFLFVVFEVLIRMKRIILADAGLQIVDGIRSRKITNVAYEHISHVMVEQSVLQRLLGFGTVRIVGNFPDILLENFSLPRKIEKAIAVKRKI